MDLIKKLKLRDFPNYQWIYLIIIIIVLSFLNFSYDNDFWFTINQGRYIINNGFPNYAINSIHDIPMIYQSWGSCTLFYLIYHYLGDIGMISLLMIVAFLTIYFFYKLCFVVSDDKNKSLKITFIMTIFYIIYLVTRPHIFTILNLVMMLYLIESYLKKDNKKYLYFLPLISLLQINMHGIYFIVLLIILCPYLINSFKFNIGIFKSDGYKKKDLFIIYGIMLLTGFLNPYGIKTIVYGFTSYDASGLLNNTITELLALNFHKMLDKIFIITIVITYIIYFHTKKKIPVRFSLFLFGTSFIAFDALKSFYFFIICSFFPISYIFENRKSLLTDKTYSRTYHYLHLSLTLVIIVIVLLNIKVKDDIKITKYVDYLDKEVIEKENVKIYNNFMDGSYLEYRGYYCYVDPRAEVFLKSNNQKEDIYKEYDNLQNLKIDYREFLDKYKFDYLLLDKNDVLYYLMTNFDLNNYKILLKDDNYMLLKLDYEDNV